MTNWLKALILEFSGRAEGTSIESVGTFQQACRFVDDDDWQRLKSVVAEIRPELGLSVQVVHSDDASSELLDDDLPPFPFVALVRAVKTPIHGGVRFLTSSGLVAAANDDPEALEAASFAQVADIDAPSRTAGLLIEPWDDRITSINADQWRSPRMIVSDLSGGALVPAKASTWVMTIDNELLKRLAPAAAQRLARCLPNDLARAPDARISATFRGSRRVVTVLPPPEHDIWCDQRLTEALQRTSHWIYCESPDAETRHALVSSEISRIWPGGSEWTLATADLLDASVETAKTAYRLHLHGKGVEALKLMSDLRKGLAEDAKAVAAQTASLSGNLWRDAAVALAALVLKPSSSGGTWIWLPAAAALYLAFSLAITRSIADESVKAIHSNEQTFRKNLYTPIVSADEYEGLAGEGYRKSFSNYLKFSNGIAAAYIIAIFILMAQFLSEPAMWAHCESTASQIKALILVTSDLLIEAKSTAMAHVNYWFAQLSPCPEV